MTPRRRKAATASGGAALVALTWFARDAYVNLRGRMEALEAKAVAAEVECAVLHAQLDAMGALGPPRQRSQR